MVIEFKTVTGSTYRIDTEAMTWNREVKAPASGKIRQEGGILLSIPVLKLGQGAMLHDSKVLSGHIAHFVYTSDVIKITEIPVQEIK